LKLVRRTNFVGLHLVFQSAVESDGHSIEAMNRELHRFSDNPAKFAAYIRAIKKRAINK
jgi:hypothetical protein